ncbi:MAG: hypothetical protein HDQ99_14860 [Lachnospiraceae bacterium]|nr:hypothetical protein [Lachnospiraceae bacterium]
MAEQYSFFNSKDGDRKYNASHWADYFFPLFKSGVFNGDLQVVANGGMSVKVKEGYAWIDGYAYHLTDGLVLDPETASGNMNRADSIVIRLDLTNRWIKGFCVKGGNYSGIPTPPEPAITATVHELVIANISIPAGATEITQDMITDTRMDVNLCGWVCGAVDQIKFEQIKEQFDAFFSKYSTDIKAAYDDYTEAMGALEESAQAEYEEMLESFTAWIAGIKEVLSGDVAGNLLLKIEEKMEKAVYDADNDGIVDNAKRLDGKEAGEYMQKVTVIDNPDDVGVVTEQGYPVGCMALNGLLGGIRFGVDDEGNYGYIKAGADTVTPFKQEINIPASALGFSVSFVCPYSTNSAPLLNMNFVAMKQFSKYTVTVSNPKIRYRFNGGEEQNTTKTFDISNVNIFSVSIYPMNRGSGFEGGTVSGAATKKS